MEQFKKERVSLHVFIWEPDGRTPKSKDQRGQKQTNKKASGIV